MSTSQCRKCGQVFHASDRKSLERHEHKCSHAKAEISVAAVGARRVGGIIDTKTLLRLGPRAPSLTSNAASKAAGARRQHSSLQSPCCHCDKLFRASDIVSRERHERSCGNNKTDVLGTSILISDDPSPGHIASSARVSLPSRPNHSSYNDIHIAQKAEVNQRLKRKREGHEQQVASMDMSGLIEAAMMEGVGEPRWT
jgi:hypothetical protein